MEHILAYNKDPTCMIQKLSSSIPCEGNYSLSKLIEVFTCHELPFTYSKCQFGFSKGKKKLSFLPSYKTLTYKSSKGNLKLTSIQAFSQTTTIDE